jgi:ribonuclease P protein component
MERLLKRRDFLYVRDGRRANASTLSLQARHRESRFADGVGTNDLPPAPQSDSARVGFTVTKKEGCAVERNRIRRRLREAVRLSGALHARAGHDYVMVGRRSALDASFATIVEEMVTAFGRVHAERQGARKPRRSADEAAR